MNYEIKGTPFPVVICKLANGERMITEKGAMVWMSPNMEMSTVGGGLGRMFSKAFSGESMFQNIYTARGDGMITFGSCFPGRIVPLEIAPGREFVLQKSAFLASTDGVELSIHFNKKLGAGFFGGEGFIMQRLSGTGMAFVEIDGELVEYTLEPGQKLIVDTGNVAGFDTTVDIDIQQVPGLKNKLFGGEGLFNTTLTGPGRVWLQTMPISGIAQSVAPFLPSSGSNCFCGRADINALSSAYVFPKEGAHARKMFVCGGSSARHRAFHARSSTLYCGAADDFGEYGVRDARH